MSSFILALSAFLFFVAGMIFASLFLSLPVMLLWDWLMPGIFGLRTITWLEAWGLLILAGLLVKSDTKSRE